MKAAFRCGEPRRFSVQSRPRQVSGSDEPLMIGTYWPLLGGGLGRLASRVPCSQERGRAKPTLGSTFPGTGSTGLQSLQHSPSGMVGGVPDSAADVRPHARLASTSRGSTSSDCGLCEESCITYWRQHPEQKADSADMLQLVKVERVGI